MKIQIAIAILTIVLLWILAFVFVVCGWQFAAGLAVGGIIVVVLVARAAREDEKFLESR